jgi:cbb3-type cytochrome oxidase maturation protein
MSMLYVLIPLALMLLAAAAWALIWAIRSGQFDDLESHGWSVVLDDDQRPPGEAASDFEAGPEARFEPAPPDSPAGPPNHEGRWP